jgi:hypothetical protein
MTTQARMLIGISSANGLAPAITTDSATIPWLKVRHEKPSPCPAVTTVRTHGSDNETR